MDNTQRPDFLEWFARQDVDTKKGVLMVMKGMIDTEGDPNKSEVLIALLRKTMNNMRDDLNLADMLKDIDIDI